MGGIFVTSIYDHLYVLWRILCENYFSATLSIDRCARIWVSHENTIATTVEYDDKINGRCGSKFQIEIYARSFEEAREQRQYIINVQRYYTCPESIYEV